MKQGHQFALDKLNERSKSVLDKGLQRLAKGALGADESGVQGHDDAAFDLINKYVLSEAKFDEKDADAMYDKYLSYAGVKLEKPEPDALKKDEYLSRQTMEYDYKRDGGNHREPLPHKKNSKVEREMFAAKDSDAMSNAGRKEQVERDKKMSSAEHAREMEKRAADDRSSGKLAGADNDTRYEKKGGADRQKEWTPTQTVAEAKRHVGSEAWRRDRERGKFDDTDFKCNLFVSEMLEYSGAKVPKIGGPGDNPPLARDWANKEKEIVGYVVVDEPKPGDVAASKTHVGIVTDAGKTVSASSNEKKNVENDWGFRPSQKGKITFRRYIGSPTK